MSKGAPPSRRLARRRPAAVRRGRDARGPAGEDAGAPRADIGAAAIPGRETFPPAAASLATVRPRLGAHLVAPDRCEFRVWAPDHDRLELHLVDKGRRVALAKGAGGYHEAIVDASAGTRYVFVVNGNERPDPASRLQPDGVHQASAVVPEEFEWRDARWRGIPLDDYVIYELHVGTFTDEGTFDAIIPRLDALRELGITAVELL